MDQGLQHKTRYTGSSHFLKTETHFSFLIEGVHLGLGLEDSPSDLRLPVTDNH